MIAKSAAKAMRSLAKRLVLGAEPTDWQSRYRNLIRRSTPEAVFRSHGNAAALDQRFNVGAYLERNPDVAAAVASAGEAVFHFLEYGAQEQRKAHPIGWDAAFVRQFHGIVLPERASAAQANAMLRQAGVSIDAAFLTEAHFMLSIGLHGPTFAQVFEQDFYAVGAAAAGSPLQDRDRIAAIRHFAAVGLAEGIAPHPDHRFDAGYYRDALRVVGMDPADAGATDADLRRHWARVGIAAGAHANPKAWFLSQTGVRLPESVLAQWQAFRRASRDLPDDATLAQTMAHLEATPMPGAAAFDLTQAETAEFLVNLGGYKRRRTEPRTAEWLYTLVLNQRPDEALAALSLADMIYGEGRISTEIQYRKAVPPGYDVGANQITLAERLQEDGRFEEALSVAETLPDTLFSDVALRTRRQRLGQTIFERRWGNLEQEVSRFGVPKVQEILTRALGIYTPPFDTPQRARPLRRIAILANDDLYQCKLYRADQKIDQLRAAGYTAELYVQSRDLDRLGADLHRFDAVIFMRLPAFPKIIDVIVEAACMGLATFYDIDDLIFDPELFPPPLATYSGTITAEEHAAIACGVPLFRAAMALCDYGIASTPTIAAAMQGVVRRGEVFVHRNALGTPHLRALRDAKKRPSDKLVLYYGSGTKAHKAEFHEILEPALADVLAARRGRVELRIIGEFSDFRHLDPQDPDVHLIPPIWDFEAFCQEVAQADINLSILAPSVLTDAKSEIKWMEAAMYGVPSVVSPTATYREVIDDGVDGLLCSDRAEFREAILRLLDDADLRTRIGEAAREKVLRDYSLSAMGANFDAIFQAVRPADRSRKTRLAIVNVFYPPQDIGGATRVVQDNVRDLISQYGDRFEIDVICTLEGGLTPYEIQAQARDGAVVWTITAGDGLDTMDATDPGMADVFGRVLDRIAPDIVHFHCLQRFTASVVDAARARDIPYVITLHDGWWISPNQFIESSAGVQETYDFRPEALHRLPERARITGRCLAGARALLAVSPAFAALHRDIGLDTVQSVENGVSRLPELVATPGREGRVRVGHIGGAARHKGFPLLRAAVEMQRFDNLDIVILDHALPLGHSYTDTWNGTPVTFLPRVPLHRVGEIYGQIDVLVAPSTWPESYGLVTREALALGKWVIASDRGAVGQNIVEGETGHIVPVDDPGALAACLAKLDRDPETYRKPPPRKTVLRPARAQADALAEIYAKILDRESE